MARRGENIYKRKDGRWEARYPKSYSSEGHIVYGYVYGQTYHEAKIKRTQMLVDMKISPDVQPKKSNTEKTLRELTEEWLKYKRETVKEATYVRYRHLYEKHIDPSFGSAKLKKMDTAEIEAYIYAKQKTNTADGLAVKTIQDILSVYRLVIRYGIEKKYLPANSLNNEKSQKILKTTENKVTVLLPKERTDLEQYILGKDDIRYFGIILAMYTGIRIGELCALRWNDIDLENGIMYVNHTLQRLRNYSNTAVEKTRIVISTPKTASSVRMIPLSSFLIDKLKVFASSPDHYVLTDKIRPEEPRSYLYFYKRQLSICGLPEYTFHTIRHTFATRCIEEGIDVKSLSEILGHSNVKITMNRYVHPSLETKRQHLERLSMTI